MARFKTINDPKKLLERIARLFSDPARWTRFTLYRDQDRKTADSHEAYCFCSRGAFNKFSGSSRTTASAESALKAVIGKSSIIEWNDSRGPRGAGVVAAAFRKAAASFSVPATAGAL